MPIFADLLHSDGEENIGGTAQEHYIAPWDKVTQWPTVVGTSTLGDGVTLEGSWGFASGECFTKLYSTLDTGEVQDKMVGESDGKSYESTFELFYPGSKAEALDLISRMKNRGCVLIAREATGKKRVLGNSLFRAVMKEGSFKTGKKTSERKGTMIVFETRGYTPAPILPDSVSIPLTPAS